MTDASKALDALQPYERPSQCPICRLPDQTLVSVEAALDRGVRQTDILTALREGGHAIARTSIPNHVQKGHRTS